MLFLRDRYISVTANTTTWVVKKDGTADFTVIQEAVDNATDGDTIFVCSGIYYEHIIIFNKTLSLIGENRDQTIIDGNETGTVISISAANNLSIKNLTMCRSDMSDGAGSGISLSQSNGNDIRYNTITNNTNGISLQSSSGNTISDNMVMHNEYGISLQSSSGNTISDNMVMHNEYGISLQSSSGNTISDNMVMHNEYGISLQSSSGNTISDNIVTHNNHGIIPTVSDNNVVSSNNVFSNRFEGMFFSFSYNNMVLENTMTNNSWGIFLFASGNNTIYHNNFNNTNQVGWEGDEQNFWDNGVEGNYWTNYTGVDNDPDGIGDTQHIINDKNIDNHPLMGFISDFTITSEGQTYQATTICNSTISVFRYRIGSETGNKIISFDVTGRDTTVGFCRISIPTRLMEEPFIVLADKEEINSIQLDDISNETHVYLYLTYIHSNNTITIISSETLRLYYDLIDIYIKLQEDLGNLNSSYLNFLENYSSLLANYTELQNSHNELNSSYLNFLENYSSLLANYTELLLDYSKEKQNFQNLIYIFAATTAIFILVTIYLSKHVHQSSVSEDRKGHYNIHITEQAYP